MTMKILRWSHSLGTQTVGLGSQQPWYSSKPWFQQCRQLSFSRCLYVDEGGGGGGGIDGGSMKKVVSRAAPKKLKQRMLNSRELQILLTPEVKLLAEAFSIRGAEVRVAGGAIRDVMLGLIPTDLDLATDAPPQLVKEIIETTPELAFAKGPKNAHKFGSFKITMDSSSRDFDLTSLRLDVKTDGRHAEVEFVSDWSLDAARRDFTCNSLYLSTDGILSDYFNGEEDLGRGKVVFIGDPNQRIGEDVIRILRYFRFHAIVAGSNDHDATVLEALRYHAPQLSRIPPRQHWLELKKLLSVSRTKTSFLPSSTSFSTDNQLEPSISLNAPRNLGLSSSVDPNTTKSGGAFSLTPDNASSSSCVASSTVLTPVAATTFETMHDLGLLPHMGFPSNTCDADVRRFVDYCRVSYHYSPRPVTLLQGIFRNDDDARFTAAQFGLSKSEEAALVFLVKNRFNDSRLAAIELCKLTGDARLTEKMKEWRPTSMPLELSDMDRLSLSRKDQRKTFKMMEMAWRKSGKTMTKDELWALAFDKSKKKRREYEKSNKDEGMF